MKATKQRSPLQQARHEAGEAARRGIAVATPERIVRTGEAIVYLKPDAEAGERQRVSQVPLDRLLNRKVIDGAMYAAGDRYRTDAYLAGVIPSGGIPTEPGYSAPGPSIYLKGGEKRANAYQRWTNAACALGPELRNFADEFLVVAECHDTMAAIGARIFGRRPNQPTEAAATEMAKMLLSRLIRFYDKGT